VRQSLGAGDGSREHLLHRRGGAKLRATGTKGVGAHHLGAGGDIGGMDPRDHSGVGEAEQLGNLAGLEAERLQLRTHGTIEEQEVLAA